MSNTHGKECPACNIKDNSQKELAAHTTSRTRRLFRKASTPDIQEALRRLNANISSGYVTALISPYQICTTIRLTGARAFYNKRLGMKNIGEITEVAVSATYITATYEYNNNASF